MILNKPAPHQNLSGVVCNQIMELQVFGAGVKQQSSHHPKKCALRAGLACRPQVGQLRLHSAETHFC